VPQTRTEVGPGLERFGVSAIVTAIGAVLLACLMRGFGLATAVTSVVAIGSGLAATLWLARRLPADLDHALRRSTLPAVLWLLLGVTGVVATARLATFMVDESKASASMLAFDPFFASHSCLTSYYWGARFQVQGVPNLYRRTLYEEPNGDPHFQGTLAIDPYQYPPPFLLLPRLALLASANFSVWRSAWFGIEGVIVVLGLIGVAAWIGGPRGLRAGLLALLVWTSVPTLLTLQIGNFQLVAFALALGGRIAMQRGRSALGGAMLAFASVAKIFPAVLVLELLFRRRWRDTAWTAGFAAMFVAIALVVLGPGPFESFVNYQLPRLSSGAAFETLFVHPDAVACSHAIFAIVQKLGLMGIPGMSTPLAAASSALYSVVLVIAAIAAARAGEDRWIQAMVWLALLQLASLRSPFVPDVYAQFAPLWIVTLLLARGGWRAGQVVLMGAALLSLQKIVPTLPILPIPLLAALTLLHQGVFIALCGWLLVKGSTLRASPVLH